MTQQSIKEQVMGDIYDNVAGRMSYSIKNGDNTNIFGDYCEWSGTNNGHNKLNEAYFDEAKAELDTLLEEGNNLIILSYMTRKAFDDNGKLKDFLMLDDSLLPEPRRNYRYNGSWLYSFFKKSFIDDTLTQKKKNYLAAADRRGDAVADAIAEAFADAIAANN